MQYLQSFLESTGLTISDGGESNYTIYPGQLVRVDSNGNMYISVNMNGSTMTYNPDGTKTILTSSGTLDISSTGSCVSGCDVFGATVVMIDPDADGTIGDLIGTMDDAIQTMQQSLRHMTY